MDTYTPEEFTERLKKRGIVKNIEEARYWVARENKESYTEEDFERAYHAMNTDKIGRQYKRENYDGAFAYYQRDDRGMYWFTDMKEY